MKIQFLGDSITQGVGASCEEKTYVSQVGKRLGCEALNYGVSGTRIAKQANKVLDIDHNEFMCRAVIMPKDADFTFVFGGTNDFGHGDAKFGCFDDRTGDTFCGLFTNSPRTWWAYLVKNCALYCPSRA